MKSPEEKLARVLGERIEVVEYSSTWPALFKAEGARLAGFFPAGSIRSIEHVGSTAVPGLSEPCVRQPIRQTPHTRTETP